MTENKSPFVGYYTTQTITLRSSVQRTQNDEATASSPISTSTLVNGEINMTLSSTKEMQQETKTAMISEKQVISSFFLGPEKMVVQERDDGSCIARGILPIPIREDIESALVSAMKSSDQRMNVYKSWSGQIITDRNNALYDSLTNIFAWCDKPKARREIYESLRLRNTCESPYHGIVSALEKFADLKVCGLLAEVADNPSEYSYSLGGAVLVSKAEFASKWKLTSRSFKSIKEVRGSQEAQLVKCTMDELLGIALVTDLPIVIATNIYESSCVDGLLQRNSESEKVVLSAPYFSSNQEAKMWRVEQERQLREMEKSSRRNAVQVPRANEIKDASTFLRLKNSEKRAILRASGVNQLPRPREGIRAVDALMIPLLDEEVAYEVLRRLAETRGNFEMAAEMNDFESRKPQLAKQINDARKKGDSSKAKELCDELNSLSTLRFDPTNPDGVAGEWDVEEWYWEQRKRVYGIIAA